jgi:hypothetical protein
VRCIIEVEDETFLVAILFLEALDFLGDTEPSKMAQAAGILSAISNAVFVDSVEQNQIFFFRDTESLGTTEDHVTREFEGVVHALGYGDGGRIFFEPPSAGLQNLGDDAITRLVGNLGRSGDIGTSPFPCYRPIGSSQAPHATPTHHGTRRLGNPMIPAFGVSLGGPSPPGKFDVERIDGAVRDDVVVHVFFYPVMKLIFRVWRD